MNSKKWNEWFAGLVDGDGCFYINEKEKSISFELTTHVTDSRLIYNIKNVLKAGSVQLRSGSKSLRYRVKKKEVLKEIVNRVNGQLYQPVRVAQFKRICEILDIKQIESPTLIEKNNGYLSGLIDSDGSIAISVTKTTAEDSQLTGVNGRIIRLINSKAHNQISLKVTSVYKQNLVFLQKSYGFGSIYIEKTKDKPKSVQTKYHWTIKSAQNFQTLYDYLKIHPLKSVKMHRIRLSLIYFKYKSLKYHLKLQGSVEAKVWTKFSYSWYKYSF